MDAFLDDYITESDLKEYENRYNRHRLNRTLSDTDKFEYAWSLVRSKYSIDIRKGVTMFEEIFAAGPEESKRDCLFYVAVGCTKLKDYQKALRFARAILKLEPENNQARALEDLIDARMKKEGLVGAAIVGGAALALAGLAGIGIAAYHRSKKKNDS